jgi:Ca2+/H+ antiporter
MNTFLALQSQTVLDNLNAAIAQLAIITAALSPYTPEGVAAIKAQVRIQYAREVLTHALTVEAQAEPINEAQS